MGDVLVDTHTHMPCRHACSFLNQVVLAIYVVLLFVSFLPHKLQLIKMPWNHRGNRVAAAKGMLQALEALLCEQGERTITVLFFCKEGRRRSAAVLATTLIMLFGFELSAAKFQIESRRDGATLSTANEGNHPPTYEEVQQLVWHLRGEFEGNWY